MTVSKGHFFSPLKNRDTTEYRKIENQHTTKSKAVETNSVIKEGSAGGSASPDTSVNKRSNSKSRGIPKKHILINNLKPRKSVDWQPVMSLNRIPSSNMISQDHKSPKEDQKTDPNSSMQSSQNQNNTSKNPSRRSRMERGGNSTMKSRRALKNIYP